MRPQTLPFILGTRHRASIDSRIEVLPNFRRIEQSLVAVSKAEESVRRELQRHFPVVCIAYFESFVRYTVAELIDASCEHLANADKLLKENNIRINADALHALHGEWVTIGEVIAYSLGYSSKEAAFAHLSKILDRDVLADLRTEHPKYAEWLQTEGIRVPGEPEPKGPPPWIPESWDACMAAVDRTFELRHIFCHEAATGFEVSWDEIETSVHNIKYVLSVLNSFLAYEVAGIRKDADENLARAKRNAGELEQAILEIVKKAEDWLPKEKVKRLAQNTEAWQRNRDELARWIVEDVIGAGETFGPLLYHRWLASIGWERLRTMYWLRRYLDDTAPRGPLPGRPLTVFHPASLKEVDAEL